MKKPQSVYFAVLLLLHLLVDLSLIDSQVILPWPTSNQTLIGCEERWYSLDTSILFPSTKLIVFQVTLYSTSGSQFFLGLTKNQPSMDPALSPNGVSYANYTTPDYLLCTIQISQGYPSIRVTNYCDFSTNQFYVIVRNIDGTTNSYFYLFAEAQEIDVLNQLTISDFGTNSNAVTIQINNYTTTPRILPNSIYWKLFYFKITDDLAKSFGATITASVTASSFGYTKNVNYYVSASGPAIPSICYEASQWAYQDFIFTSCNLYPGGTVYLTIEDINIPPQEFTLQLTSYKPPVKKIQASTSQTFSYEQQQLISESINYILNISDTTSSFLVLSIDRILHTNHDAQVNLFVRPIDPSRPYFCNQQTYSCTTLSGCAITLPPCEVQGSLIVTVSSSSQSLAPLYFNLNTRQVPLTTTSLNKNSKMMGYFLPGDLQFFSLDHGLSGDPGQQLQFTFKADPDNPTVPMTLSLYDSSYGTDVCAQPIQTCNAFAATTCLINLDSCTIAKMKNGTLYLTVDSTYPISWDGREVTYTLENEVIEEMPVIPVNAISHFLMEFPQTRYYQIKPWGDGTLYFHVRSIFSTLPPVLVSAVPQVFLKPCFKLQSPLPYPLRYFTASSLSNYVFIPPCKYFQSNEVKIIVRVDFLAGVDVEISTRIEKADNHYFSSVMMLNPSISTLQVTSSEKSQFLDYTDDLDSLLLITSRPNLYKYYKLDLSSYDFSQCHTYPAILDVSLKSDLVSSVASIALYAVNKYDILCNIGSSPMISFLDESLLSIASTSLTTSMNGDKLYGDLVVPMCQLVDYYNITTGGSKERDVVLVVYVPYGRTQLSYSIRKEQIAELDFVQHLRGSVAVDYQKLDNYRTIYYPIQVTSDDVKNGRSLGIHAYLDKMSPQDTSENFYLYAYLNAPDYPALPSSDCSCYQITTSGSASGQNPVSVNLVVNPCDLKVGKYVLGLKYTTQYTPRDEIAMQMALKVEIQDSYPTVDMNFPVLVTLFPGQLKVYNFTLKYSDNYVVSLLVGDVVPYNTVAVKTWLDTVPNYCSCSESSISQISFTNYYDFQYCLMPEREYYLYIYNVNPSNQQTSVSFKFITQTKENTLTLQDQDVHPFDNCDSSNNQNYRFETPDKLLYFDVGFVTKKVNMYLNDVNGGSIDVKTGQDFNCLDFSIDTSMSEIPISLSCSNKVSVRSHPTSLLQVSFSYRICETQTVQQLELGSYLNVPVTPSLKSMVQLNMSGIQLNADNSLMLVVLPSNETVTVEVNQISDCLGLCTLGTSYSRSFVCSNNEGCDYVLTTPCSLISNYKVLPLNFLISSSTALSKFNVQLQLSNPAPPMDIVELQQEKTFTIKPGTWTVFRVYFDSTKIPQNQTATWQVNANWTDQSSNMPNNVPRPYVLVSSNPSVYPLPTGDLSAFIQPPCLDSLTKLYFANPNQIYTTTSCCKISQVVYFGIVNPASQGTVNVMIYVSKKIVYILNTDLTGIDQSSNLLSEVVVPTNNRLYIPTMSQLVFKVPMPPLSLGEQVGLTLDVYNAPLSRLELYLDSTINCYTSFSSFITGNQFQYTLLNSFCTSSTANDQYLVVNYPSSPNTTFRVNTYKDSPVEVTPTNSGTFKSISFPSKGTVEYKVFHFSYQSLERESSLELDWQTDNANGVWSGSFYYQILPASSQDLRAPYGGQNFWLCGSSSSSSNPSLTLDVGTICQAIESQNDIYFFVMVTRIPSGSVPPSPSGNVTARLVPSNLFLTFPSAPTRYDVNTSLYYVLMAPPKDNYYIITIVGEENYPFFYRYRRCPYSYTVSINSPSKNLSFPVLPCEYKTDSTKHLYQFNSIGNFTLSYQTKAITFTSLLPGIKYSRTLSTPDPVFFEYVPTGSLFSPSSVSVNIESSCSPSYDGIYVNLSPFEPEDPRCSYGPSSTEQILGVLKMAYFNLNSPNRPFIFTKGFKLTIQKDPQYPPDCVPTVSIVLTGTTPDVVSLGDNEAVQLYLNLIPVEQTNTCPIQRTLGNCPCPEPNLVASFDPLLIQYDFSGIANMDYRYISFTMDNSFAQLINFTLFSPSASQGITSFNLDSFPSTFSLQIQPCDQGQATDGKKVLSQLIISPFPIFTQSNTHWKVINDTLGPRVPFATIQSILRRPALTEVQLSSSSPKKELELELSIYELQHFIIKNSTDWPDDLLGYRIDVLSNGLRFNDYSVKLGGTMTLGSYNFDYCSFAQFSDPSDPTKNTNFDIVGFCNAHSDSVNPNVCEPTSVAPSSYNYDASPSEADQPCTLPHNGSPATYVLYKCDIQNRFTVQLSSSPTVSVNNMKLRVSLITIPTTTLDANKCYETPTRPLSNPNVDDVSLVLNYYWYLFVTSLPTTLESNEQYQIVVTPVYDRDAMSFELRVEQPTDDGSACTSYLTATCTTDPQSHPCTLSFRPALPLERSLRFYVKSPVSDRKKYRFGVNASVVDAPTYKELTLGSSFTSPTFNNQGPGCDNMQTFQFNYVITNNTLVGRTLLLTVEYDQPGIRTQIQYGDTPIYVNDVLGMPNQIALYTNYIILSEDCQNGTFYVMVGSTTYNISLNTYSPPTMIELNKALNKDVPVGSLASFSLDTGVSDQLSSALQIQFNYLGPTMEMAWVNLNSVGNIYCSISQGVSQSLTINQCLFHKGDKLVITYLANQINCLPNNYTFSVTIPPPSLTPVATIGANQTAPAVTLDTYQSARFEYNSLNVQSNSLMLLTLDPPYLFPDEVYWEIQKGHLTEGSDNCFASCFATDSTLLSINLNNFFGNIPNAELGRLVVFDNCFHCGSNYDTYYVDVRNNLGAFITIQPLLTVITPTSLSIPTKLANKTLGLNPSLDTYVIPSLDVTKGYLLSFNVQKGALSIAVVVPTSCGNKALIKRWCLPGAHCDITHIQLGDAMGSERDPLQSYLIMVYGPGTVYDLSFSRTECKDSLSQSEAPFCNGKIPSSVIVHNAPAQDLFASNELQQLYQIYLNMDLTKDKMDSCYNALQRFVCSYAFPICSDGLVEGYGVSHDTCWDVYKSCGYSFDQLPSYTNLYQYSCSRLQYTGDNNLPSSDNSLYTLSGTSTLAVPPLVVLLLTASLMLFAWL